MRKEKTLDGSSPPLPLKPPLHIEASTNEDEMNLSKRGDGGEGRGLRVPSPHFFLLCLNEEAMGEKKGQVFPIAFPPTRLFSLRTCQASIPNSLKIITRKPNKHAKT